MKRRNFLKSQHIRQYKSERFSNPFFRRTKRESKWKPFVLLFVFLLVWAGVIYMIFFSSILFMQRVNVQGLTTIPKDEVEEVIWDHLNEKRLFIFSKQHKFFLQKKVLHQKLQDRYNFVTLKIDTNKDNLDVFVEERITSLVWITDSGWYFIDLEGTVSRPLFEGEANVIRERLGHALAIIDDDQDPVTTLHPTMPIIEDLSKTTVEPGFNILNESIVETAISFDKAVRQQILSPYIYQVENNTTPWIALKTENGFDVYFDLKSDVQEQIETLGMVLDEYSERLAEITYIDLRFGNHVYVK
ncbi:MAG: hypothetical protein ABH846_02410 [Patescibacteria group bacterium]